MFLNILSYHLLEIGDGEILINSGIEKTKRHPILTACRTNRHHRSGTTPHSESVVPHSIHTTPSVQIGTKKATVKLAMASKATVTEPYPSNGYRESRAVNAWNDIFASVALTTIHTLNPPTPLLSRSESNIARRRDPFRAPEGSRSTSRSAPTTSAASTVAIQASWSPTP